MIRAMAWRNIWRNRRRSLITLSAMVFGLFACLISFAIGDGAHLQMIRVATSTLLGHIQLNQQGFQKSQKTEQVVPERSLPVRLLQEAVQAQGDRQKRQQLLPWQQRLLAWSPRLFGAGLVSTGNDSSGGFLLGLDLVRESRVTRLPEAILKAMAQEALQSGHYKDRLPPSYLAEIAQRFAASKKKKRGTCRRSRSSAGPQTLDASRAPHGYPASGGGSCNL